MSPTGKVLYKVGDYGNTVSVVERTRGTLVLRFTKPDGGQTDKALGHHDSRRAQQQARELSRQLAEVRASESGAPGARDAITVREVFARYAVTVSAHKKGQQPKEDERRRVLWLSFFTAPPAMVTGAKRRRRAGDVDEGTETLAFGPNLRALAVTPAHVRLFVSARTAGAIVVDGINLQKKVKPRTVDADIVWLLSVFSWAYNEARLLKSNPLRGTKRPEVTSQLRPMANAARAAKLLEHAHLVHPRFPLQLACVRYLGWRISAICLIDGADIDRKKTKLAPHGQILKRWENDKEGMQEWIPMPKALRDAFDAAGVAFSGPVFPSTKAPKKAWSRWYARELLERTEALAKLDPIDGGDFHPYRRLWATERKGLPRQDVMFGGQWKDPRTVDRYQSHDPETLREVMLFDPTQKQTAAGTGATSGTQQPKKTRRGGRASA